MKNFYTYMWLRYDGTPYYVGKGVRGRAFLPRSRSRAIWNPPPKNRIMIQEFPSNEDAIQAEIFLISYYGRLDIGTGILRNFSNGGEGEVGHRGAFRGKKFSEDHKKKISIALKGRIFSEEHCKNLAEKNRARALNPVPPEVGRKISQALRSKKRAPMSEEVKHHLSLVKRGVKVGSRSESAKRNMSIANKANWILRKQSGKVGKRDATTGRFV